MLCYHWLLSIHMCTCLFVFPGISYLGGIGQWLSLDRAVFPGKYRPGIPRTYKPTNVHTRTCTCTWCVSTWCTWVLDWWKCKVLVLVLDYEYLKYLSTWPIALDPNPARRRSIVWGFSVRINWSVHTTHLRTSATSRYGTSGDEPFAIGRDQSTLTCERSACSPNQPLLAHACLTYFFRDICKCHTRHHHIFITHRS